MYHEKYKQPLRMYAFFSGDLLIPRELEDLSKK